MNINLLGVSMLAGTIIGAGVFSLPYVFQAAGLSSGFFFLFLAAAAYVLIHLMYADVILRTEGEHRFVGYAKIYLGRWASRLAILMTVVEMVFVLTIYLVLSQSFSGLVTKFGTDFERLLLFWLLGSAAIFLSLRRLALLEFLITGGIVAIIAVIFLFGLKGLTEITASALYPNLGNFLLPLAPILFALSGRVAIPSVVNFCRDPALIKKSIIAGTVIPAVVYGLFVLGILALSPAVSEDAVSGLINQVPAFVLAAVGVLGILSLFSSYIVVGLDVKNILVYDLRLPGWLRFLLVILGPPLLYLAGFQSFIALVSFVGGIFLSLEGIFIIAMWLRADKVAAEPPILLKKLSRPIIVLLCLVFAAALLYALGFIV